MKIIAIGGGEVGGKNNSGDNTIRKEIIRLSGKKNPKLLFIPTASSDAAEYVDRFSKHYSKLGCKIDVLYLVKEKQRLTLKNISAKILNSDIVYVGGGNTLKMMKLWRKLGVDKILKKAQDKNIVLAGLSAGCICWFKLGNSDSLKFSDKRNPLIKVKCLDFVPIMACPHYDMEKDRRPSLTKMIKKNGGISLALDNCAAVEIIDDNYRIITCAKNANGYKVYRKNGKVVEEKLPKNGGYYPIEKLYNL